MPEEDYMTLYECSEAVNHMQTSLQTFGKMGPYNKPGASPPIQKTSSSYRPPETTQSFQFPETTGAVAAVNSVIALHPGGAEEAVDMHGDRRGQAVLGPLWGHAGWNIPERGCRCLS